MCERSCVRVCASACWSSPPPLSLSHCRRCRRGWRRVGEVRRPPLRSGLSRSCELVGRRRTSAAGANAPSPAPRGHARPQWGREGRASTVALRPPRGPTRADRPGPRAPPRTRAPVLPRASGPGRPSRPAPAPAPGSGGGHTARPRGEGKGRGA